MPDPIIPTLDPDVTDITRLVLVGAAPVRIEPTVLESHKQLLCDGMTRHLGDNVATHGVIAP